MRYGSGNRVRGDRSSLALDGRQMGALVLAALLSVAGVGRGTRGASAEGPSAKLMRSAAVSSLRPVEMRAPVRVARIEEVDPATAGLDPLRLDDALTAIRREIGRGAFPGGALAVGRKSQLVLLQGLGKRSWSGEPVDAANTIYDLASLTKVVATTTAVMLLVEDGRMDLDAPVQRYLPEFSGGAKAIVTVRHLLTHTSGLPAWLDVSGLSREAALEKIVHAPLTTQPGETVEYSDLGFVVLFEAAARAAGEPVPRLLQRRVFLPLGMHHTSFAPGDGCLSCAPTLLRSDGTAYQGTVHDPIARALGGVAGNAGLFSTAADLARFAAMLANGGELDGVRVLDKATVRTFTTRQRGTGTRALGWDTPESDGTGAAGRRISDDAFGHTGFTGTSLWVDPDRGTWTVLLTNRTYEPRASNRIMALRRTVHDEVAEATR